LSASQKKKQSKRTQLLSGEGDIMLYAVTTMKLPHKWRMLRNKRKAIRLAKLNPGSEVWSHEDIPEVSAWDWPTFKIGAKRVWPE